MFDHHYNEKPSCLDAAYERSAISTGLIKHEDAKFPENRLWITKTLTDYDPVRKPAHYTYGSIEAITVIEDWKLNFNMGNALKYIARADHKGNKQQDIKKAIWYLERELHGIK